MIIFADLSFLWCCADGQPAARTIVFTGLCAELRRPVVMVRWSHYLLKNWYCNEETAITVSFALPRTTDRATLRSIYQSEVSIQRNYTPFRTRERIQEDPHFPSDWSIDSRNHRYCVHMANLQSQSTTVRVLKIRRSQSIYGSCRKQDMKPGQRQSKQELVQFLRNGTLKYAAIRTMPSRRSFSSAAARLRYERKRYASRK